MAVKTATPNRNGASKAVEVRPAHIGVATVRVVGDTELITNNWSVTAIDLIEAKQKGEAQRKKAPKEPDKCYEDSMYRLDDGSFGFPAAGFKCAIVDGVREFDNLKMTAIKQGIFIYADGYDTAHRKPLVRLNGQPYMRRDMVRNETGVVDLRYRAAFTEWSAVLTVEYNRHMVSDDEIVNLISAAGRAGIGNWRPSAPKGKSGWAGRFHVEPA